MQTNWSEFGKCVVPGCNAWPGRQCRSRTGGKLRFLQNPHLNRPNITAEELWQLMQETR